VTNWWTSSRTACTISRRMRPRWLALAWGSPKPGCCPSWRSRAFALLCGLLCGGGRRVGGSVACLAKVPRFTRWLCCVSVSRHHSFVCVLVLVPVGFPTLACDRYAKYLDCGADMFFESVLSYWLSNGRQPNGMVIRLQGFGRGSFGGNFHTHNSLHIPPGLDVVCYSNGRDYARGFRNLVRQAKAGRVVMSVDCTHLLNLRHTIDGDLARMQYFTGEDEEMSFESVRTHGHVEDGARVNRLAIVAYGNGVVAAQQVRLRFGVGMHVHAAAFAMGCRFVSFRFVSFRFVSFRFVSFRFVSW